ncbi:Outer membrane protein, RND efflux system precursor [hydrothermal vent metagenome]|uniref:Outer membrane protein, RND efflux system n=1 Tax=hydrothermal vent metagenome TaxID=652676 RepID=A0A3B0VSF1_9ZZZZ
MVHSGDKKRMRVSRFSYLNGSTRLWAVGSLAVLGGQPVAASTSVVAEPLSFNECVHYALTQNPEMTLSAARIQQAKSALSKAESGRLPQINLSLTAANTTNALSAFGMKLQQQSVMADDFSLDTLNNPDAYTDFNTRIEMTLPVWNGGKMGHYEAQASEMILAAKQGDLAMQQYLTYSVYHAYEAIHAARAHIQVAEQAKRTAEAFVQTTQNLVNEGVVVRSELLSAKVHFSMAEARLLEAKGNEIMALDRLRILMNQETSTSIEVADRVDLTLPADSVEALLALALESNPKLRAKQKEVASSRYDVRIANADQYPRFNIMMRQEWNHDALALEANSYTVAGVLSWNVLDFGVTKSAVDMASSAVIQKRAALKSQENSVRLNVLLNWQKKQVERKQVQTDQLAVEHAAEAQNLVLKRYEGGLATMTEVLASQTQLDETKAELVSAKFDVNIYKAKLRLATGTMSLEQL